MVADQKIDLDDFREIKLDCMYKITTLEAKLAGSSNNTKSIDSLLHTAMNNLGRLDILYEPGTMTQKTPDSGFDFPEKLIFNGFEYQTPRLNEAVRLIYSLGEGLSEIKNRKEDKNLLLSGFVVPTRIELVSKV